MKRELRDELEVPGHVLAITTMTSEDIKQRLNEILNTFEKKGWKTMNDVPECDEKAEFRKLGRALGLKIEF